MFNLKAGPLVRQYAVVITVNLSMVCLGIGLAWPSPVLVKLGNKNETVLSEPISEDDGSWVVSIGFLCAIFTNFLPAFMADRLGRKLSVILACLPKLAVCLLFTFANQVWMLLLGRGILGISDSVLFSVVPTYAAEIASKEVRGGLGMILQISCSLGILAMLAMGPFISYVPLNVVFTCVTIVSTLPIFFLPDSPYFLYSKGRTAEALEILTSLRGSEELANEELQEYILASSKSDEKVDLRQLFRNKIFVKSIILVIILGAGLNLVGFNAISFYLQTILNSTQTSIKSETASVVIGYIQLLASFSTATISDRFGRKPILTVTFIGMIIGMIGLGVFFKIKETEQNVSGFLNFVPLVSLILVVFCYSAGLGSLYWMLITELFEGPARAIGVSSSLLTSITFMFFTTKYFPAVTRSLGPAATYWFFAVMCVLFCLFILFCVPETKGKTFAEIQVSLGADEAVVSGNVDVEKSKHG